jgi:alpha,alpha-trehalose phosphorylase
VIPREIRLPPEHLYPADEWRIVERGFSRRWMGNAETIFSLANGFLGMRGTFEEGRPGVEAATFLNGFHETWPIVHAEEAYGFARTGQTIISAPDATLLKLYVDDEPLYLPTARVTEYERELDFRQGVLRREMNWSTPAGKQVRIRTCRWCPSTSVTSARSSTTSSSTPTPRSSSPRSCSTGRTPAPWTSPGPG